MPAVTGTGSNQAAAAKIAWLLNQMRVQQRSGVALKDQMGQPVHVPVG